MHLKQDPAINDSTIPNYRINWIDPISSKKGDCTIFTYGKGKDIAIASFRTLYPDYEMNVIEELEQVE